MKLQTIHGMKFRNTGTVQMETGITWSTDGGAPDAINIFDSVLGAYVGCIYASGRAYILPGYMCDGASGPTWDDVTNLAAAFWHDLYYEGGRKTGWEYYTRKQADQMMARVLSAVCSHVVATWRQSLDDEEAAHRGGWWTRTKRWARRRSIDVRAAALWVRYKVWYAGLRVGGSPAARAKAAESKYKVVEVWSPESVKEVQE